MSSDATSHNLVAQTTGTTIERQQLTAAGRAANRAAADYLFADYRQRRAESTLRTQRAALVLWVQYLVEVGAASELLAEAQAWALSCLDDEELEELAEYGCW